MFFGQRNIVQQTPEMNDMMILRDNFCTDCGQQGGLTSIPSGTFFDQQKAEVETRTFFGKPENKSWIFSQGLQGFRVTL